MTLDTFEGKLTVNDPAIPCDGLPLEPGVQGYEAGAALVDPDDLPVSPQLSHPAAG
jgi:hypothetical protein